MATPAELVSTTFSNAQSYANSASAKLATFASALNSSIYTPPTLSVTWSTLAAPTLPTMPGAPDLPVIAFNLPAGQPTELNEDIPTLDMPTFSETAPTLTLPDAPTLSYGTMPTIPAISSITVPDAPTVSMPDAPTMMSINSVSFAGVDLHEDWLESLSAAPTVDLVEPTPYSYSLGPAYASDLLNAIKSKIASRISGGSGLPPAVEQAIWDRARSRETQQAQANLAEITRTGEALGFAMVPGVVAAQTRQGQRDYYDKLSGLSRDIAIKQADLEQSNLKDAITSGMQLEGQLIDYSYKLEQLTFESAKFYAENAIQLYNASVEHLRVLLERYQAYAAVYKTIIDSQLAKVEVYKAQLQAEMTKAEINNSLVQRYKAMIEAGMAQVEIYRAEVAAAQTLVELERAKIGAAGEQIRAHVAQVNAETAKVEAYKATVQAEATKVDIYKTKAEVFATRVNAVSEQARALVTRYSALVTAKTAEWDGYRAKIAGETARIQGLTVQSTGLLEAYKAETLAIEASARMATTVWESNMKQYEAGINVSMQAAKINNDAAIQTNNARLDAAKAGTQVYAQLTSSAYSMMHANAGVSGNTSTSVSYSYSGDVSGSVPPISSI